MNDHTPIDDEWTTTATTDEEEVHGDVVLCRGPYTEESPSKVTPPYKRGLLDRFLDFWSER